MSTMKKIVGGGGYEKNSIMD
jgi:hypothetical protein